MANIVSLYIYNDGGDPVYHKTIDIVDAPTQVIKQVAITVLSKGHGGRVDTSVLDSVTIETLEYTMQILIEPYDADVQGGVDDIGEDEFEDLPEEDEHIGPNICNTFIAEMKRIKHLIGGQDGLEILGI